APFLAAFLAPFLALFLVPFLAVPLPAQPPTRSLELTLVAKQGDGTLYSCGEQRVLVLRGTPEEMGRQHGMLLPAAVRRVTTGTLAWVARRGLSRAELQAIAHAFLPHLPERSKQELRGLAKGSGVPLQDLILVHAMPSKFHCSGAAVANSMTRDGKLYHTRSLDYALDVGTKDRLQNHALLIVRQPKDGIANAVPAWAGFLGSVTGLNLRGISVGEMGSNSSDEDYAGVPMIFLVREVLRRSKTLDEAVAVFRKGPRTCGFNFIVGSGRERSAVALEVTRSHFFVSGMGDKNENVAPHSAMPDAVRRSNHFVSEKLAATQRKVYDPRKSKERSWELYEKITAYLVRHRGKLDAPAMVGQLRLYPPHMGCLHQAVMAATDNIIWVSQAKDGRRYPFPGAQNMTFYGYDLATLLREPETLKVPVLPPKHAAAAGNLAPRHIKVKHRQQEIPYVGTMVQAGRAGMVWHYSVDAAWLKQNNLAAAPIPDLEVHEPRRVPKGGPALLIFSTGNQRMLVARTLAQALARLGTPVAVVQTWTPGTRRAAGTATAIAPQVMPARVDRERMVWMGVGLGGDILYSAQGGGPKRPPLIFAFTGRNLAQRWNDNEAMHGSLAKLLSVQPEALKNLHHETWIPPTTAGTRPPHNLENPVLFFGLKREKVLPVELQEELIRPYENARVHWLNTRFKRLPMHLPDILTRIRVFMTRSTRNRD
ncbi:MAG: C45 family autoproteolytic acyltransferase/hydrolase, partial [Planctomycetota bacterium]